MSEQRYTLEEARLELARQECDAYGHDWDVLEADARGPVAIVCPRCGASRRVQAAHEPHTEGSDGQ